MFACIVYGAHALNCECYDHVGSDILLIFSNLQRIWHCWIILGNWTMPAAVDVVVVGSRDAICNMGSVIGLQH